MEVIRIALSGKMRSGKDTVASHLTMRHGFVKMAFADKLKDVAHELFDAPTTEKCRPLLVELSRHLCAVDPAVWIKYVINRIPMHRSIVISDLRYPNEYYTLKGLGFQLVRIVVAPPVQLKRLQSTEPDLSLKTLEQIREDLSETALDGESFEWDLIMDGGMPATDLFNVIDLFMEDLTVRRGEE